LKLPAGELGERKETLERTILLGSMSWCFIAHSEYTVTNRPLADRSTFERIRMCLKEMEDFLGLYG
jgi:hypothetical protein